MDPASETWTTAAMLSALRRAGFEVDDRTEPERRGDRMMIRLPGDRLAWFPRTAAACDALRTEDRTLALVRRRCGFAVPEGLFASSAGWVVRSMVRGKVDAVALAGRLKADAALRLRAATFLGQALAALHGAVTRSDVEGRLPTDPAWPLPRARIRAALPTVFDDADLLRRIDRLLSVYDAVIAGSTDRVLIHADLGLHNLAYDDATGDILGIFDFGSAAWADRHLDFRYLVFAAVPDALLDETMSVYEAQARRALDRDRILVCNAAGAAGFLADRAGHAPEEVVAGRTLEQDLAWTRWALRRAGF